jgi:hypothetical protein
LTSKSLKKKKKIIKVLSLVKGRKMLRMILRCGVPVAHTCNPRYSGGRDQEDCSSKPDQANSSTRPYFEKPFTKIGPVE